MGIVGISGIVMGVILVVTFLILISFSLKGKSVHFQWPPWLNSNIVWATSGWIFVLFLGFVFLGDWWIEKVFSLVGLSLILGFSLFGFMMYHNPAKPFRHKFAKIGVFFLALVSVWYLFGEDWWREAKYKSKEGSIALPAQVKSIPGRNESVAKVVEQFWRENLSPEPDAEEMIAIAEKESQFNQFEEDGVTPLRGRENRQDVGVMQVNEGYWLSKAQALGHNIYTLEGNLQMALWIRQNYGADEWNTSEEAKQFAGRKGYEPVVLVSNFPRVETFELAPGQYRWIDGLDKRSTLTTDGKLAISDVGQQNYPYIEAGSTNIPIGWTSRMNIQSMNGRGGNNSTEIIHVTVRRW